MRGPNIAPLPRKERPGSELKGAVLLKTGDNITTDHIMPAGAKILPLRSNLPKISEFVFEAVDPGFPKRAMELSHLPAALRGIPELQRIRHQAGSLQPL